MSTATRRWITIPHPDSRDRCDVCAVTLGAYPPNLNRYLMIGNNAYCSRSCEQFAARAY